MRLFVAVELPSAALTAAMELSRVLQRRVSDLAPAARFTWIPADRMHLTIRFIGEVATARVSLLETVLSAPFDVRAFTVTLGAAGAFPSRGTPRVLWLGIEQGKAELMQLEQEVSARLETAGIQRDERTYHPHLTLARAREPHGLRVAALLDQLPCSAPSGGLIDAITLFESRLSPRGPMYAPLRRMLLQPA
jgi:RNA 2',3'-cyclic 3'-phosphodiesterase